MRTIGYSTTVFTLMLLGLELGRRRGALGLEAYAAYLAQAAAVPAGCARSRERRFAGCRKKPVAHDALGLPCVHRRRRALRRGAGGRRKGLGDAEIHLNRLASWREGLHGPNFGYDQNHCVIAFTDGGA